MCGIRILRQHHIALGFLQAGEIGLAACDRVIVVGRAVIDPDRTRHGVGVGGIAGRAIRIERNVGGELRAGLVPQLVEAIEAGVERGLSAARKSHQHDAIRIDARVFGEDLQRAVDVDDEIEPAEQRLVGADRRQPAAAEAVDHEGRNPHRIEVAHPRIHAGADAARSVHQHHDGKFSAALRDAEFAGHRDLLAVGVAGEELLVGNRQRRDRVDFGACRDVLRHRLRRCFDAGDQ